MVEFNSAWKFISADWSKTFKFVLLSVLLLIIPVVGPLAFVGLMIKVLSSVIDKEDDIPPVFEDFGTNIVDGLKLAVFWLLLSIPATIVIVLIAGSSVATLLTLSMSADQTSMMTAGIGLMMSLIPAAIIIGVIYAVITPGLICNYAKDKKFSAFFNIGKAFNLVAKNIGGFVMMLVINFVYSLILGFASSLLAVTGIGAIVSICIAPLSLLINSKIMGDWYAENANKK
ncbi:Uncharacterised protein [Candidatus Tiddalikarchaeum anstoanum]|nr:Uncharacterised protein [Candidatus Tiddalikarchaeum anstoanum]